MSLMTTLAAMSMAFPVSAEATPSHLRDTLKQTEAGSLESSLTLPVGVDVMVSL